MWEREAGSGTGEEAGLWGGASEREGSRAAERQRERGGGRLEDRRGAIYFTIKSGVQTSAEQDSEIGRAHV